MKKKIDYENIVFKTIIFVFALFQLAFYNWMIYTGDNPAHLKFVEAILNENVQGGYLIHMQVYPLYHITTRLVSFICLGDIHTAGACVLTIANIISAVIVRHILNDICRSMDSWKKLLIDFISVFYLIFETFAGPLTDGRIYQRQCGPNPWHNPTITFVRPIGLIALFLFVRYMDEIDSNRKNDNHRGIVGFSILSALSVLAKPSFMMVFLPAMGIYVFLYWKKDFKGRFCNAMRLLYAVIPTIAIILYQFLFCQFYNDGNVSPVRFQIGGFSRFTGLEIVKVCIATFPVPIMGLILYGKKMLQTAYTKISYLALVFGVAEMFLMTNGGTGDFSWGYDLAVGISTMVVLGESLSDKDKAWRRIPLFIIFTCQVVIGFYYVINMYNGGGLWI